MPTFVSVLVYVFAWCSAGYFVQRATACQCHGACWRERWAIALVLWLPVLVFMVCMIVADFAVRGWGAWKNFRQKRKEQKASSQAA